MSFYIKDIYKYRFSHHSLRRLRERIFNDKEYSDDYLIKWINEIIEFAVIDFNFDNGDIQFINWDSKIKIIVTKDNLIKTIIKI